MFFSIANKKAGRPASSARKQQKQIFVRTAHGAWKTAYKRGFKINTSKPSDVVTMAIARVNKKLPVLDAGCGNGRNSVFLANKGFSVDAIDLVYLGFLEKLSRANKSRISFRRGNILNFQPTKKYGFVVLARLVQYLSPADLNRLFAKLNACLSSKGIIAISYAKGKIMTKRYSVKEFPHDIGFVKRLLAQNGFRVLQVKGGSGESKFVPFKEKIESYNIVAQKN